MIMTADIVDRLGNPLHGTELRVEAANEIARLRETLAKVHIIAKDGTRNTAAWGEVLEILATSLNHEDEIARAVAAEREACAKILDECASDWNRIRDPGMANNARSYAKKIRNRSNLS
jgi:hypothetical protein